MARLTVTYAGDVSAVEAYRSIESEPDAVLVDVRTAAEWAYVGVPVLTALEKEPVMVSWSSYPDGVRNDRFLDELADAGVDTSQPLFLLCRSGARSRAAAAEATRAGYTAFNISEGFEGPLDDTGRRNTVSGWRLSGLPWRQH